MSSQFGAEYYRARAMEMMEKAQEAPTKATRLAYLNLAQKWTEEAERLEAATQDGVLSGQVQSTADKSTEA